MAALSNFADLHGSFSSFLDPPKVLVSSNLPRFTSEETRSRKTGSM